MPVAAIKTTGDLRDFLAEVIIAVREGTIDQQRATAISKIACQINDSFVTEAQAALVALKLGFDGNSIGDMPLLGTRREESKPLTIEHVPAAEEPAPVTSAVVEFAPSSKGKMFCAQCDRTVSAHEGERCTSAFCKARAA